MSTAHASKPRNAFAMLARTRRAATFHDRRAPRGGTNNEGRLLLDAWDDEKSWGDEPARHDQPDASSPPSHG